MLNFLWEATKGRRPELSTAFRVIAIVGGVVILLLILGLLFGMAEWAKH